MGDQELMAELAEMGIHIDTPQQTKQKPSRPKMESWTCPTCDTVHTPRIVHMDSEIMYTLDYMIAHADANAEVGVTHLTGCEDAKVIGDRYYGQLRYWGLVEGAGQGRYRLTLKAYTFARGLGWSSVPEYVIVRSDKVIGESDYTITATQARAKMRRRKAKGERQ